MLPCKHSFILFLLGDSNEAVTGLSLAAASFAVVLILIMALCGYQKRKKRSLYTSGRS